tara:strand:+ start:1160 stop:1483 length:324 start_codon:yes stop_codon:yes gene_type:complete
MIRKRLSKKYRDLIQSVLFFFLTIGTVACLIIYLWVYTEIDETLLAIEIQNSTSKELMNELQELKSDIESLSRADAISKKAKKELKMSYTDPETLLIIVDKRHLSSL